MTPCITYCMRALSSAYRMILSCTQAHQPEESPRPGGLGAESKAESLREHMERDELPPQYHSSMQSRFQKGGKRARSVSHGLGLFQRRCQP